jgi:hypothetical protein
MSDGKMTLFASRSGWLKLRCDDTKDEKFSTRHTAVDKGWPLNSGNGLP